MTDFAKASDPQQTRTLFPAAKEASIKLIGHIPRLILSDLAWDQTLQLTDLARTEVSWMGVCDRLENGDIYCSEIFVPEQAVHSTETEIPAPGLSKLLYELVDQRGMTEGEVIDAYTSKLFLWGHKGKA